MNLGILKHCYAATHQLQQGFGLSRLEGFAQKERSR
jgi:DNA-binding transcriptional MerR regulator/copper chaperone CopZ